MKKIKGYCPIIQISLIPLLFGLKDFYCIMIKHLYTSTVTISLANFNITRPPYGMQQEHRHYNTNNALLDPSPALPVPAISQSAPAKHFITPLPFPNVKSIHATNPTKLAKVNLFSSVNTVIDKGLQPVHI